jgi:hypothetical protein
MRHNSLARIGSALGWAIFGGLLLADATAAGPPAASAPEVVPVVVVPGSGTTEKLAADELAGALGRLYSPTRFPRLAAVPAAGRAILVGCLASSPELREYLGGNDLPSADAFVVTTARRGPRELAAIVGAKPRAAMYGVYALLEKLGCGFYLSYDAFPAPRGHFSFDGWKLADVPWARERIVFDWHNFLSGCSTWNLDHWKQWITQAEKMGFNTVMVHAYGNNPMFSFDFGGQTKPVGYLSTTVQGRDWSTQHVDDVRRLWGGSVFDGPAFGPEAGFVAAGQRAAVAQRLMHDAFACAQTRGMGVYFAVDVDTASANPQELIATLPPTARFSVPTPPPPGTHENTGRLWLANPDTPEGDRYYDAQVGALLRAYPQLTSIVVWFRAGGTPWMELKPADLPPAWQKQYQAELARSPETARQWHAPALLAIGRIVAAYQRAVQHRGGQVEISSGTWNFQFLPAAHRFFPPEVKLIGLDYNVLKERSQLSTPELRREIHDVAAHRPVVVVTWAQHDDGHYVGRPYTPPAEFETKLLDAGASGYGIIHWTTRPLDLYFQSLAKQVWWTTKDQPLATTCDEMALRSFGPSAQQAMAEYLHRWITEAPQFGRETSDRFIDRTLPDIDATIAACRQRLAIIARVDPARLTADQRRRLEYFRGMEEFILRFHRTQEGYQRSQAALRSRDRATARAAMAECRPGETIEQFARTAQAAGITRGEQGLVVSLNLRWLTHYVRQRQLLGLEPIRYCFGPTSHDPLAQAAGRFTFHLDQEHHVWQRLGEQETGAAAIAWPVGSAMTYDDQVPGIWRGQVTGGIQFDKPLTLPLSPIMSSTRSPLTPGHYRLQLALLSRHDGPGGPQPVEVSVVIAGREILRQRIDVSPAAGGRADHLAVTTFPVEIPVVSEASFMLTPRSGKAILCGVVLERKEGSD